MKTLNKLILNALYNQAPQSIAELSNAIGKSVPNITKTIQELLRKNFISSEGLAPSTGGRRAIHYSLNTQVLPRVLAIAIDQYSISLSLLDLANKPIKELKQEEIKFDQTNTTLKRIQDLIDVLLIDQDATNILAIGISMPGFVDSKKGINTSYSKQNPLHQIRDAIQHHLDIPTYIENDSTAIAIAEHLFGTAKGINNILVINLNWGVGLGMILEGKLFKGHSGFAGEFSHIPLSNPNKLCSCGKRGCLEVEASLVAALEYASEKIEGGQVSQLSASYDQLGRITIDQLIAAALHGDQVGIEAFAKIGFMLGKGIATLIHIINPEKIIISGKGAEVGKILIPQIQAAILEFAIHHLSKDTSIEISTLHNAQIIGTAAIAVSSSNWEILHKKEKNTNEN